MSNSLLTPATSQKIQMSSGDIHMVVNKESGQSLTHLDSRCIPPPGPSNIIVRTPFPAGPPKDVRSQ